MWVAEGLVCCWGVAEGMVWGVAGAWMSLAAAGDD